MENLNNIKDNSIIICDSVDEVKLILNLQIENLKILTSAPAVILEFKNNPKIHYMESKWDVQKNREFQMDMKYISSEIQKCNMGETSAMSGNLNCSGKTGSSTIRAAEISLRDFKNPYDSSQNSVILGSQYVKGNVYITSSNQNVILHACFKDSCGNDANKTGVTIPVD